MSRNLIAVDEGASLQEIQALMTANAIGRVPVIREGRVVGIVTRKDVIRALHGPGYLRGFSPPGRATGYTRAEVLELIQQLAARGYAGAAAQHLADGGERRLQTSSWWAGWSGTCYWESPTWTWTSWWRGRG